MSNDDDWHGNLGRSVRAVDAVGLDQQAPWRCALCISGWCAEPDCRRGRNCQAALCTPPPNPSALVDLPDRPVCEVCLEPLEAYEQGRWWWCEHCKTRRE